MKNKRLWRSALALLLAVSLLVPFVPQIQAAQTDGVSFEQVDNSEVSASLLDDEPVETPVETKAYADDDMVRVSILLDGNSVVEQGFSTMGIGESRAAQSYRQMVMRQQSYTTNAIENALGGELDVVWNLTLITNVISANVPYGQIETIADIKGVAAVEIESRYEPPVLEEQADAETYMAVSGGMTHVSQSWANGYTGAGQRIAIIDTGLDTDHQSILESGYLYALRQNIPADMEPTAYYESLNLLDKAEILEKLPQLHAYNKYGGANASKLHLNKKVAFGYNYVDYSYDITHDHDSAGDHGTHVAGIAAANRYIPKDSTNFVNALDAVKVTGNAPDAQLLIMKVFGANGGAYDSDIYAAIEDSIILGADTVNLSLGSVIPGSTYTGVWSGVMDTLKNCDTTVVVAAGNNEDWPEKVHNASYLGDGSLYATDVNMLTIGEPGSMTNSLAVASVESVGSIVSGTLHLNGKIIDYNDQNQAPATMKDFPSLDGSREGTGTRYEYVMVESYGAPGDFDNLDVAGKIVLVSRGMQINFGLKANEAAKNGAAGIIIYNNESGTINMNLEGYEYEAPCIFITQENAQLFKNAGEAKTAADGSTYYTGRLYVKAGQTVSVDSNSYYTMSNYSSWGVTGDLALKPEITAPGGKIYSMVNGGKYKSMSGTSMSSPQVAGIGALIDEYVKDNGYVGKFASPSRGLTQSLLMSTAVPLKDANGNYYSLLQQGAGLADAALGTSADSYIKMTSNATVSYDDGKVKAELGDDPTRKGVYTFGFEIHNLDGKVHTYDLRADVFAQDHFEGPAAKDSALTTEYMSKYTTPLDADTVFTSGGKTVEAVTVPAGASVVVYATVSLTDDAKQNYLDAYFENGTYIQAYVFADAQPNDEGVDGTTHSIPMLAFYGNWTDPSMFWGNRSENGQYAGTYSHEKITDNSRAEYYYFTYQNGPAEPVLTWQPANYFEILINGYNVKLGGNPLVADSVYMPERDAVSTDATLDGWLFSVGRNTSQNKMSVTSLDTGKVYASKIDGTNRNGAFWNDYTSDYGIMESGWSESWQLDGMVEDEHIEFAMTLLPEYYDQGKMGYGQEPGEGATASVVAVVDGTNPNVLDIELDAQQQCLQVEAADNNYVAAVVLYNGAGNKILSYEGAKQEIDAGEAASYMLDYSTAEDSNILLQVFDYAMNVSTYRITVEGDSMVFNGTMMAYNQTDKQWVLLDEDATELKNMGSSNTVYNAATAIGNQVFAVTDADELLILDPTDLSGGIYLDTLEQHLTDLAYRAADGYLYGVSDANELVQIDPATGNTAVMGQLPFQTNTLACDNDGNFYSNKYGTGEIYRYTLETVTTAASQSYDFDDNGTVDLQDAQLLLDYVTGKEAKIAHKNIADIDGDGDIDTYDAYLLKQALPHLPQLLAVAWNTESAYLQAMEVDPNSNVLYWTSYFTSMMQGDEISFAFAWSVDLKNGTVERHTDFWDQLTALFILDADASSPFPPADRPVQLNISMQTKTLAVGQSAVIHAGVSPWNVENAGLVWKSTDESVATVDANGNVTAQGIGTCEIIVVSAMDESISASCSVAVSASAEPDTQQPTSERAGVANVTNTEKEAVPGAPATLTLELPAAAELTNGLQTASIDTTDLTLVSITGADLLSFQQTQSLLTVGYVHDEAVQAGEAAVTLIFETVGCGDDRAVILRELQRNNTHMTNQSVVDLASHTWGDWVETTPAGCGTEGMETRTCGNCGATEERTIPAGSHAWGDWTETTPAGCGTEGIETRTCGNCGATEEQTIPAGSHAWGDWTETTPAGCETEGTETRICGNCGATEEQKTPATDHAWGEWTVTKPATEAADGEENRTCGNCGKQQTRAIPADGHVCPAAKFADVDINSWYHTAVDYVLTNGLMNGTSATTFAPNATTTRGQIVTILYRSAGSPSVAGLNNPFADVPSGTYYTDAVIWAYHNGVVNGTSATKFSPEMSVTREQLVTILYRYADSPEADASVLNGYTDAGSVSGFARAAMAWAVDHGVVNGTSATTLSPKATATRAQIAAILMRYLSA